jgi:hypothetical protein
VLKLRVVQVGGRVEWGGLERSCQSSPELNGYL